MPTILFNDRQVESEVTVVQKPQGFEEPRTDSGPTPSDYRAMSPQAVASFATGLLSALLFADFFLFVALPVAGIIVGGFALKRIRAEPQFYTGSSLAVVGILLSGIFLLSGGGLHAYVYATEVPEGYTRISYDQLRDPNLPLRGFQLPPESARQLDGADIFIKGYMYPPPGKLPGQKVEEFVLCRDNGDCCFGGDPPSLERILVRVPERVTVT
ncbi:MAG: DUF4190 domain-containing protein, partial [Pirellulales bacterium]|nr:DUF4190 domain-containing protein [Pirellulales bacterium]